MGRSRNKGPLVGNYVEFVLTNRIAVAAGQTLVLVDRVPLPQGFRACHVSLHSEGTAAVTSAVVTNNAGTALHAIQVVSAAVPKAMGPADLTAAQRTFPKGDSLDLKITTDGGGAADAGEVHVIVTGYFTEHITKASRFVESGQSAVGGPVTGRIALLTLRNTQAVANAAIAAHGALKVPFGCKVMAISYGVVGQTEGTGTITALVRNATGAVNLHSAIDIDALTNDVGIIDATTGTALANRSLTRGDTLELHVGAGAADVVPIQSLTASVWVWVQGHCDFTTLTDLDPALMGSSPGAPQGGNMTGPAEGGSIVIPFINKRAAQAGIRVEDAVFLPVPVRLTAVTSSKAAANSTARQINRSGSQAATSMTTQNVIGHPEGTAQPAPGSWAGVAVSPNVPAGEDNANRNFAALDVMQFALQVAGDAVLADTAHVIGCIRGQFYTDPAND